MKSNAVHVQHTSKRNTTQDTPKTPAQIIETERSTVLFYNEQAERSYIQAAEELVALLEGLARDATRDAERTSKWVESVRKQSAPNWAPYAESVRSDTVLRIIETTSKLSALHTAREQRLAITLHLGAALDTALTGRTE